MSRQTFIEKTISCPLCLVNVPVTYPNPRLYTIEGRDFDGRVTHYRWLEGHETDVLPHYYAVWQCPQCLFANFVNNILDPKGDREFYVREAYKQMPDDGLTFLSQLSELVPRGDDIDRNGAIAKHLAAIYTSRLPAVEHVDHNKLARLCLRLGWLYREADMREQQDTKPSRTLEQVQINSKTLHDTIHSFIEVVSSVGNAVEERAAALSRRGSTNPYSMVVKALGQKTGELHSIAEMFEKAIERDIATSTEIKSISGVEETSKLQTILMKAKGKWPDIPMNEDQALRMAVDAFDFALNTEKAYKTVEQAMAVIPLMVQLMQRTRDRYRALDLIAHVSKGGISSKQELIEKFGKRKAAGVASEAEEREMQGKLSTLDSSINALVSTRRDILTELIEEKREEIERIISQAPDKSPEGQAIALEQAGISHHIIHDLSTRGLLKDARKRGFFGLGA